MKKSLFYFVALGLFLIILTAFTTGNFKYTGGAPAGYTGSPGDGKNCTYCHNGTASIEEGMITSDVGTDGYLPGETYNIMVSLSGMGDKGFEVSPQDSSGNLLGTLEPGLDNKLVGGGKYVTHSTASSEDPKEWSFTWTAPEQGTGDVTFYGAFTINMPVTKLSTLVIPENNATIIDDSKLEPFAIYPNPAKDVLYLKTNKIAPSEIDLFNMNGILVTQLLNQSFSSSDVSSYRLPNEIDPGVYFVVFTQSGKRYTKKVFIK